MISLIRLLIGLLSVAASAGILGALLSRRKFPELVDPQTLIIPPPLGLTAMRRTDGAIVLRWSEDADSAQVYMGTSPDTIRRSQAVVSAYGGVHEITISDVEPDMRYFFEVVLDGTRTLSSAERTIPNISIPNFRDIGGYPTEDGQSVRWGLVYRSSAIANLSDKDASALAELGIQMVCDMRSDDEVAELGDELPAGAEYVHLPAKTQENRLERMLQLFINPASTQDLMTELYTDVMIDNNPQIFRQIFERIADSDNLPMVIHCAAGKDRTGLAVALLLRLLGVSEEMVIADYTQSNLFYDHYFKLAETVRRQLAALGVPDSATQPLLISKPEYMQRALNHITRKYGTVESYLRMRAKLDNSTLARIKENLLMQP